MQHETNTRPHRTKSLDTFIGQYLFPHLVHKEKNKIYALKIQKTVQNQTEEQQNVLPTILITIDGNKSEHSLDRFKKYFKNFVMSCPSEHAFPILLRHKQGTIFFPYRIHRNVFLVRPSSNAITTSFSPPDFSPSALSAMRAKKPNFKRL